jgi:hypothetical protein
MPSQMIHANALERFGCTVGGLMGRKPGRGSTRATGDKRSPGQEQAGGSIGRVRATDETRKSHLGRQMSEPPRDAEHGSDKKAKYQEDAGRPEE